MAAGKQRGKQTKSAGVKKRNPRKASPAAAKKAPASKKAPAGGKAAQLSAYRKKRRLANRKVFSISGAFALVMVFIVVIVYIARGFLSVTEKTDVATIAVEYGSIDLPKVIPGIIIREETVYESNAKGTLSFNYDDLTKVKKGAQICTISDDDEVGRLSGELRDVEEEILALQSRREDISGFSQDVKRANRQIQELVDNNRRQLAGGNIAAVYSLKENVERNIAARNNMLLSESRGSVKEMVELKTGYERRLNDNIAQIGTQSSGVLCYTVDGQEKLLSFDRLELITPEQTRMQVDYGGIERKRTVEPGEPVFKVVTSNEWYIGAYVPSEFVFDWKVGQARTVFIEKDEAYHAMDMTVASLVGSEGEKEHYLLLRCVKNMTDFLGLRNVNIKLSDSGHEGLKIPMNTIVDKTLLCIPNEYVYETDKFMVIRKGAEVDETVPIAVKDADDEFTYVYQDPNGTVKLGDTLVKNDDRTQTHVLTQVENVRGVFILNNGYADFVKIEADGELPEKGGYVILNASLNKSIRVNDQIIYDARNIVDGQKLA